MEYFPVVPINQEFFNSVTERRHMVIGLLLLACAFTDYLTYVNYPLQKRFIIAKRERSYSENQKIIEMQNNSEHDVYHQLYKTKDFSK